VTLGLSRHELHSSSTGRPLRQELLVLYRRADGPGNLPAILQGVASEIVRGHHALLRGQLIGPRGPLRDGATVEALYATFPAYLPPPFEAYDPGDGGPHILLTWLVPLTRSEAAFVGRAGWEAFEVELQRQNPDLLDFARATIELP
jgi:hypothetical protein